MSDDTPLPRFTVTPSAVRQLKIVGGTVRVDLAPTGCCGLNYTWTTEPPTTDDEVFGCTGAVLAVSAVAARALTGARGYYGARLHPPRFRVTGNPNTPMRCPCNRSFGRQWPGRGHPGCQATTPMPWDT